MDNRRYSTTYYTKFLTKQPSFVRIHDHLLDTHKDFYEDAELGRGVYGSVRLFSHRNEKIAVKALLYQNKNYMPLQDAEERQKDDINEFNFVKKTNHNSQLCSLHQFTRTKKKNGTETQYTNRMVIPFIEGENLNPFAIKNVRRSKDMAKLILRVAEGLQQLHDDGVIHGDIGSRNILIKADLDDFLVYYIDFGLAYPIDGYATTGFSRGLDNPDMSYDIPEERYADEKLPAHPTQDIFTLAKVLNKLLIGMGKEYEQYFKQKYRTIARFIKSGISDNSKERPDLKTFIEALSDEIDWTKHLSKNMRSLVIALDMPTTSDARKLLEAKASDFTIEKLVKLLQTLILNNKYDSALRLVQLKKRLSLDSAIDAIQQSINNQDYQGETILHAAAKTGDWSIIAMLLACKPDWQLQNRQGMLAKDCAPANLAALLELFTYIDKLEKSSLAVHPSGLFNIFTRATSQATSLILAKELAEAILSDASDSDMETILTKYQHILTHSDELSLIITDLATHQYIPTIHTDQEKNVIYRLTSLFIGN